MEKKRLILIGNKPFSSDTLCDEIDSYDFIVRVNRMNNLYKAGTRVDGYYLGMWRDFRDIWHGGEHRDRIKDAKVVFACPIIYRTTEYIFDYITREQYDNIELIDINASRKGIGTMYPTSTISVLYHLLNSHWADEYDITLTGVDIEGRGDMFRSDMEWNTTTHVMSGDDEEKYLRNLVENGEIKFLESV